ncbi:hypothetical protein ACEQ8H_007831 [Pleosporales sp. CAS-2024a]
MAYHLNVQESHQGNHQDEGLEEFRDFVNFIDGVGLSAQWTPEYDFDWMRFDEQQQEHRRQSQEPINLASPSREDIGTPFSTWLPSAPADDQVRLVSDMDDGKSNLHMSGRDEVKTEPFFGGFHSHFPFIHAPTYKPSSSPLELTLAMCAAGAQYCFERRSSERLFRVAKAIVLERLRQEASCFGPQSLAYITPICTLTTELAPVTKRSGPWSPLDLVKTLLILVGFATWERSSLLAEAFVLRGLLVQALRDIGLSEEEPTTAVSTSRAAIWDSWVQRESSRRTKLVAFCYVNVHTIAYNTYPLLWTNELHLQLPCCTADWDAPSASQWASLQRDGKESQMLFQQALSTLLQPTTDAESIHPIPSPIGNYVLLHALLQRIHIVRDLSIPISGTSTLSAADLEVISRALRSWTSLWQQTPESILDPNNESGPIPFTSSALLVVAYIRLSFYIGPHRRLDCRDASLTAESLMKIPDIEHNDNLLSALLYSTHALSIPVRLGIDRVARSQAFFWSVQHAISSMECAIFLSKWLCSVPSRSYEPSLTRSENRILRWVRCIVKEAYAVTDFDDADEGREVEAYEPFQLGLAVLNIWSRFFSGNTQWEFVANLGQSLDIYRHNLLV